MNPTPLNPDALEAAAAAARIDWSGRTDWNGAPNSVQIEYRNLANAAVSAYLAVAQPEVNSVEELDQLPAGSAITTFAHGRCTIVVMKVADNQWASTGQRSVWTTKDVHAGLMGQTATVLHHPEVNDA